MAKVDDFGPTRGPQNSAGSPAQEEDTRRRPGCRGTRSAAAPAVDEQSEYVTEKSGNGRNDVHHCHRQAPPEVRSADPVPPPLEGFSLEAAPRNLGCGSSRGQRGTMDGGKLTNKASRLLKNKEIERTICAFAIPKPSRKPPVCRAGRPKSWWS